MKVIREDRDEYFSLNQAAAQALGISEASTNLLSAAHFDKPEELYTLAAEWLELNIRASQQTLTTAAAEG